MWVERTFITVPFQDTHYELGEGATQTTEYALGTITQHKPGYGAEPITNTSYSRKEHPVLFLTVSGVESRVSRIAGPR